MSTEPADVMTFSRMTIRSMMLFLDKGVFFLSPIVLEKESHFEIKTNLSTEYRFKDFPYFFKRFCEARGGKFEWVSTYHPEGMCLSQNEDAAAFYLQLGRYQEVSYVDSFDILIRSPKDGLFFSQAFLDSEISQGYRTPKMKAAERVQQDEAYRLRREKEEKEYRAEYNKHVNRLKELSLGTRSEVMKVGSLVCTFDPANPRDIKHGYVEAVSNGKVKVAINGNTTQIVWTEPHIWYICSASN